MKKIMFFALLCSLSLIVRAQEEEVKEKGFKKENLFVGGNFGLTFGDYTLINLSPQIGYRFSSLFAAGVGINGQYVGYKDREFYTGDVYRKVSQGVAGLNVFGRVFPIKNFNLFLQAQPEANYIFGKETYYQPTKQEYKLDAEIAPSLLLGGGIILNSGSRGGAMISVLYDVLQHDNSPYTNRPIYNFGFVVGM
jgi:hypothetical protein